MIPAPATRHTHHIPAILTSFRSSTGEMGFFSPEAGVILLMCLDPIPSQCSVHRSFSAITLPSPLFLFLCLLPGANTGDPTHDKAIREKT